MNRGGVGARSLNIELQAALNPVGEEAAASSAGSAVDLHDLVAGGEGPTLLMVARCAAKVLVRVRTS